MRRGYWIWDELKRMQEEMDMLFERYFDAPHQRPQLSGPSEVQQYHKFNADYFETDKDIIATVELPGVEKNDIHVDVSDTSLKVRVEKKDTSEVKDKDSFSYRRSYTNYKRQFSLPEYADIDKLDATYKNGVLEIRIPKKEEKRSKTRRITVK